MCNLSRMSTRFLFKRIRTEPETFILPVRYRDPAELQAQLSKVQTELREAHRVWGVAEGIRKQAHRDALLERELRMQLSCEILRLEKELSAKDTECNRLRMLLAENNAGD